MPLAAPQPPVSEASAPLRSGGIAVRRTPSEQKLAAERKKHRTLLVEIGKKRAACEAAEAEAHERRVRGARRLAALQAAWQSTLDQLQLGMDELLGEPSALSRRDRARLRRWYRQRVPLEEPEEMASTRRKRSPQTSEQQQQQSGRERNADPQAEAGPSATVPSGQHAPLLKTRFRHLAAQLHPDRARDESEQVRLTALMKDLTRAYANGDLARLVEMEGNGLAAPPREQTEGNAARQRQALLDTNRALRRQLRALSERWKVARDRARVGSRPSRFSQLEAELELLRRMRDGASRLRAGEIAVAELIGDPALAPGASPIRWQP